MTHFQDSHATSQMKTEDRIKTERVSSPEMSVSATNPQRTTLHRTTTNRTTPHTMACNSDDVTKPEHQDQLPQHHHLHPHKADVKMLHNVMDAAGKTQKDALKAEEVSESRRVSLNDTSNGRKDSEDGDDNADEDGNNKENKTNKSEGLYHQGPVNTNTSRLIEMNSKTISNSRDDLECYNARHLQTGSLKPRYQRSLTQYEHVQGKLCVTRKETSPIKPNEIYNQICKIKKQMRCSMGSRFSQLQSDTDALLNLSSDIVRQMRCKRSYNHAHPEKSCDENNLATISNEFNIKVRCTKVWTPPLTINQDLPEDVHSTKVTNTNNQGYTEDKNMNKIEHISKSCSITLKRKSPESIQDDFDDKNNDNENKKTVRKNCDMKALPIKRQILHDLDSPSWEPQNKTPSKTGRQQKHLDTTHGLCQPEGSMVNTRMSLAGANITPHAVTNKQIGYTLSASPYHYEDSKHDNRSTPGKQPTFRPDHQTRVSTVDSVAKPTEVRGSAPDHQQPPQHAGCGTSTQEYCAPLVSSSASLWQLYTSPWIPHSTVTDYDSLVCDLSMKSQNVSERSDSGDICGKEKNHKSKTYKHNAEHETPSTNGNETKYPSACPTDDSAISDYTTSNFDISTSWTSYMSAQYYYQYMNQYYSSYYGLSIPSDPNHASEPALDLSSNTQDKTPLDLSNKTNTSHKSDCLSNTRDRHVQKSACDNQKTGHRSGKKSQTLTSLKSKHLVQMKEKSKQQLARNKNTQDDVQTIASDRVCHSSITAHNKQISDGTVIKSHELQHQSHPFHQHQSSSLSATSSSPETQTTSHLVGNSLGMIANHHDYQYYPVAYPPFSYPMYSEMALYHATDQPVDLSKDCPHVLDLSQSHRDSEDLSSTHQPQEFGIVPSTWTDIHTDLSMCTVVDLSVKSTKVTEQPKGRITTDPKPPVAIETTPLMTQKPEKQHESQEDRCESPCDEPDIDYQDLVNDLKEEFRVNQVHQGEFAKRVLQKSQGYMSDLLQQAEKLGYKPKNIARQNFIVLYEWMNKTNEERQRDYETWNTERQGLIKGPCGRKKITKRTFITSEQKKIMDAWYKQYNMYPRREERLAIADSLLLPEEVIKNYFKNKRQRKE